MATHRLLVNRFTCSCLAVSVRPTKLALPYCGLQGTMSWEAGRSQRYRSTACTMMVTAHSLMKLNVNDHEVAKCRVTAMIIRQNNDDLSELCSMKQISTRAH